MKRLKNPDPLLNKNIIDSLYNESRLVDKLFNFITSEVNPPFSISIDGDWGTGKTTIMKLLQRQMFDNKYPVYWFNPWEYKDTEHIVLSFLKNLAKYFSSEIGDFKQNLGNFFKLLTLSSIDLVSKVISNGYLSIEMIRGNADLVGEELPNWSKHNDIISEIRNEFVDLCKTITSKYEDKPLIIFFDDFDRCLPNDTIKLLESIKNLFCVKSDAGINANVIFICGINTEITKCFIIKHYNLNENQLEYAQNYFKKIFNLSLSIPSSMKIDKFIETYFDELDLPKEEGSYNFISLIKFECYTKKIKSLRKYQNIIYSFFTTLTLNNVIESNEKFICLILIIIRELYNNIYQELKIWSINNPSSNFTDLYSKTNSIKAIINDSHKTHVARFLEKLRLFDNKKPKDFFCDYFI